MLLSKVWSGLERTMDVVIPLYCFYLIQVRNREYSIHGNYPQGTFAWARRSANQKTELRNVRHINSCRHRVEPVEPVCSA